MSNAGQRKNESMDLVRSSVSESSSAGTRESDAPMVSNISLTFLYSVVLHVQVLLNYCVYCQILIRRSSSPADLDYPAEGAPAFLKMKLREKSECCTIISTDTFFPSGQTWVMTWSR